MTVYQVSMPEANDFEEFETQGEWQSHTCVIQFTYLSSTTSATDTVSVHAYTHNGGTNSRCV